MKYALFVSHTSGEHGLTIHNTPKELRSELDSLAIAISENMSEKNSTHKTKNLAIVKNAMITLKGAEEIRSTAVFYDEFTDSTWFDIFVV